MKNQKSFKLFITIVLATLAFSAIAQNQPPAAVWFTAGNNIGATDYIGAKATSRLNPLVIKTIPSLPILFSTTNLQRMAILGNGDIQISKYAILANSGISTYDASGVLQPLNFSGNVTDVLSGVGTWVPSSGLGPWLPAANGIYYPGIWPSGRVGIGTNTPAEKLEVNGIDGTGVNSIFDNGNAGCVFFATGLQQPADYNLLSKTGDNGIFWTDNGGTAGYNKTSGFVIAPHYPAVNGQNVGIRIDGQSGDLQISTNQLFGTWTQANWKTPLLIDNGSAIRTDEIGGYIGRYLGFGMTDDEGSAGWYWMVQLHPDSRDMTDYPMTLTLTRKTLDPTLNVYGTVNATGSSDLIWTTNANSPYTAATSNPNGGWTVPVIIPNGGAIRTASAGNLGRYLGFGMTDANTTGWYWIIQGDASSTTPACYPMTLLMDNNGNATITLSQNGWKDYIFNKEYKRMSIEEKEEFYSQNKHLPGIDPASVVEKKGLNVNKNLLGILQNVEEDRLDITSLYKIIQSQQAEIEALKNEVNTIKTAK